MAPARPPEYSYEFKRLFHLPWRLLQPPQPVEGSVRVRGCGVVPPLKIQLRDVIDGKHLPPLSSLDFEEYLRYQEHSVENLFFIRWLDEYTASHKAHAETPDGKTFNPQLALSFSRAKTTFFSPKSPFAINIESKNAVFPNNIPYPPPSAFDGARHEVESLLRESLTKFITTRAQRNAGFFHLMIVSTFGVLCTFTGLVPILLQIYRGDHMGGPSIRLGCIPCFWCGIMAFLGAIHGVCPVVWLFGEGRQLQDYELARPAISLPVSHTTMMPMQNQLGGDEEHLRRMELGFPTPNTTSTGETEKQWMLPRSPPPIANSRLTAGTMYFRAPSPSPSTHSNTTGTTTAARPATLVRDIPSATTAYFDDLQLSPVPLITSASGAEPTYEPTTNQHISSSYSPFTKYDLSSDHTQRFYLAQLDLPQLFSGEAPQRLGPRRRPQCSLTLGRVLVNAAPRGMRQWLNKVAGYSDEDEVPAYSTTPNGYARPGAFGPMTLIKSKLIQRSNWIVIVKNMAIASTLTAILSVSLYFAPTRG